MPMNLQLYNLIMNMSLFPKKLFYRLVTKNNNLFATLKNDIIKKGILLSSSSHRFVSKSCPVISSHRLISTKVQFKFSEQKQHPLKAQQIPQQNLQVVATEDKIQDEQVEVFHTKGTLSILDKVPGTKNPESGQLYVLMFTCGQCNTKQIKSFTKNAYHKGVVLARCVGCDKVHLVADNLGWFEDQPTNVQTLHPQKVKKVHDHAAINIFLKKAFEEQNQLFKNTKNQEKTQEKSESEKKQE